jgi:hypothetical protein
MSASIDQAFIKQYEAEVQEAYQRQGSKLRPTVRSKSEVRGASTIFQKVGKGTAAAKARNGVVPVMNIDHTSVECFLQDYYAGDWVDRMDELKTNIDERAVAAHAGAYALGRKTDELIIAAMDSATREAIGTASGETDTDGLTRAKVLLPWKGTQAKHWLGATWIPHSGLTLNGSLRYCYFYHRTAIAHAAAAEISTDVTWHGDRAAHFVNTMMSQGAVLVDNTGVVRMRAKE